MAATKKKKTDNTDAVLKVLDYKKIAESNIVCTLWKDRELYYTYDGLTLDSFTNNEWKVYFEIGKDIILNEGKKTLDEITVGLYLEKHDKLREQYENYGGYEAITLAGDFVSTENMDSYVRELYKWNAILDLCKQGYPIGDRLNEYVDMSLEDIYDEFEATINHIFINANGEDKRYDISDGLEELIDELDEGLAVGLPYYEMPMLNQETGGSLCGNITLLGALSGSGKSTFLRSLVLPTIINEDEKIVCILNEEGLKKWQREFLIWVANNIFDKDVQKYKLRDGKFTSEFKKFLKEECVTWIKEHRNQIIIIPLQSYSTNKVIKYIKKYAHLGVKYFMLDTFKQDAGVMVGEGSWMAMQQNMVKIQDVIKESALNVHIWVTFQLAKSSSRQRRYTQDNIGVAKNILDVASGCLMLRWVLEDEYEKGKHELKVYQLIGKNKTTKKEVKLDPKKRYQLIFIIKNREGTSEDYCIVVEADLSRNTYKEIGLTTVAVDF